MPDGLDPLNAATIPVAGLTAYQSIVPYVKKGDKIFVNGGSGGTGIFSLQIAKAVGCYIVTTCSTPNVELCKKLGADEVIDYRKQGVYDALEARATSSIASSTTWVWIRACTTTVVNTPRRLPNTL